MCGITHTVSFTGIVLDLTKSLHNQGVVEQEHISLVYVPPNNEERELESPPKTKGVTTHSETVTISEVIGSVLLKSVHIITWHVMTFCRRLIEEDSPWLLVSGSH